MKNGIENGYYHEITPEGFGLVIKAKEILFSDNSPFQKVEVFESDSMLGRVLTLDDLMMVTEGDEYHYHEMISHIPDSNSVKAIKANSDKVRDEYLTAMAEKYPEEDIQSKIDDNTPEANTPESNGSEPKSFWGNIKSNISGFFSKAREVVSKTTIGAYILSKYDAVKDWVKGKLNPDYEAETQTAENEPVKTEEDKTQERADMANAELPNFDENAENQEQCEA